MDGAHHSIAAGVAMAPPVEDHLVPEGITVVSDGDVSVLVEALDCELGAALPERRRDGALLGVSLASVLAELDHRYPLAEACEQATGLDWRELLRVTDEDDLGVRSVGFLGEGGEQAGAKHPGFVDDEDVALA